MDLLFIIRLIEQKGSPKKIPPQNGGKRAIRLEQSFDSATLLISNSLHK